MSWNLYISTKDEDGNEQVDEVIDGMTYNLTPMWSKAIPFLDVTRDFDDKICSDILDDLRFGLQDLIDHSDAYRLLEPENGWGDFDGFFAAYINLMRMAVRYPSGKLIWSG